MDVPLKKKKKSDDLSWAPRRHQRRHCTEENWELRSIYLIFVFFFSIFVLWKRRRFFYTSSCCCCCWLSSIFRPCGRAVAAVLYVTCRGQVLRSFFFQFFLLNIFVGDLVLVSTANLRFHRIFIDYQAVNWSPIVTCRLEYFFFFWMRHSLIVNYCRLWQRVCVFLTGA